MGIIGKIARRTFLVGTALVAGGLAVGYYFYRKPYPNPLDDELAEGETTFNPYVKIAPDNTITLIAPRAEMGQGVATTLAAIVAEELDVRLDQVIVEHGPAGHAYVNTTMLEEGVPFPHFDESTMAETMRAGMGVLGKLLGVQATGGSTSVVDGYYRMRQAGAAAREVLKLAAAKRLGVEAGSLWTADGVITDPASGKTFTYGELAQEAAAFAPPAEIRLRERAEWKILGKPQKRVDMHAKVTGAPIFGIDVRLPDMLFATLRMNPYRGGAIVGFDAAEAEKMPGVVKVLKVETGIANGFAVIADNTWRAFQAADAVKAEWGKGSYPPNDADIRKVLEDALRGSDISYGRNDGNVETAFADAPRERIVEADYSVPYLAHATMEPMNATAQLKDGRLDIWAPNQAPTLVRQLAAAAVGIETENCFVHTTYLGGGFGRRADVDYAIYAAILAKAADGRPVQVIWTREEDIGQDMYRPAAAGRFRARLGDDGLPVAVDMRIAAPSIMGSVLPRYFPSLPPMGPDKTITDGSANQPYAIANYRVGGIKAPISIPVGFWRSVGNSFNGFFHESFMDEIAVAGKLDPLEMRRRLMADHPTAVNVIDKVGAMSRWGEKLPAGKAKGFAFTLSFGTWVAEVVQVEDIGGKIRIEKVWCAADPGQVIDPGIFTAQMMSGIVYGLSSAIGEAITFADGAAQQSNFHNYGPMRMSQCPAIEVGLLETANRMGGAGEPGTPPSIPALANAVHALTGKRVRTMPLLKEVEFL
ncbi:isoquinoline 1-oxidoreductase beta subunit [Mycoplana sp. BE70]|uniref:xanthine dehydrogenase family protein molybdopterin-binding subunit n=1 Tax=Mycoplana sp. BE70 TaxID=2817775 RepID=UPI00285AA5A3|nr:molybdopterin cofactor-binding domain-containing protein [Mycoplana sp. BE70]MDR6755631.1 isoquinoline 1-oxidoreductase beta subunit [Mycoplana sp. BE70]